jgi:hypothetical protein
LHRTYAGKTTRTQLYVADPTHSTTANPAPGTGLEYELYVIQVYSAQAQTTPGLTFEGYDGADYTTVWEVMIPAGVTSLVFPMYAPLRFGDNQKVYVSSQTACAIRFECFGAVRPVN